MEAVALYDFDAKNEVEELSFVKDQVIKVLRLNEDVNWYKAEFSGQEGYIPKEYVKLSYQGWFHDQSTVEEALMKLKNQPPGAFIVRHSNSLPREFALSVVDRRRRVQNFRIVSGNSGSYRIWECRFFSLNELVHYYKCYSIFKVNHKMLTLKEFHDDGSRDKSRDPLCYVQCLYDFRGNPEDEDLDFVRGDIIRIEYKTSDLWWLGCLNGRRGYVPTNYVMEYAPDANLEDDDDNEDESFINTSNATM